MCELMFFFFKQKTAYEMRISDWSSDVCSSDLAGLGVAHGDHDLAYSRNLDAVGLSVESNSAINGSGIAVTVGAWADGLLFRNLSLGLEYQIGRASCRERVCQYV